ncbi:MAG: carbamoyltransferase [Rubrivivax sp.]|nr:carbamoyltransferase [Rubrivivax sp.]MCL4697060.1 carbamoyltransferase [Burkholderiaceae bacterium]
MITLGLNAAFHDSAAALVIDGVPVAAAEEERFSRIKHAKRPLPFSAWELPFNAIAWCLGEAGVTLNDVDHVAYSFDPALFLADKGGRDPTALPPVMNESPDSGALAAHESPWDGLFASYVAHGPRLLVDSVPHHLAEALRGADGHTDGAPPHWQWHFVEHHLAHQASAFLAAPFDACAVMTLDGRGERASTAYGVYRHDSYTPIGEVHVPHSLGLLYEQVTSHLGFLHSSDEYKVMALAASGQPRWASALRERVRVQSDGGYVIDPIDLAALAGPARRRGTALEQPHFDLAASLQQVLEETVLQLAQWLRETSGQPNLAMAGGVGLNCLMNARLRDEGPFDAVWVQPAAGDAGTALGSALWIDARARSGETLAAAPTTAAPIALAPRRWSMTHAYLGPKFSDDEIESLLRWAKLGYRRFDDASELHAEVARRLAGQQIVGWFQGAMEWGPRALGARSILASPIEPAMQARLNELKDREDFRPVAPAVAAEALGDWFEPAGANGGTSPFMLFTYRARPERAAQIPAACHSDGSARVQTVHAQTNPAMHALLAAFARETGVPVLVNTSFNVRGEPIVCTPKDAIDAFHSTPLDALVIGRCLLAKPAGSEHHEPT